MNEFLIVALAHLLAVMSPGPDLAVVMSIASGNGIKAGIKTAAGVALGIGVHVSYCLVGVALLLKSNQLLFDGVRMIGSLYLLWLAFGLAKSALNSRKSVSNVSAKPTGSGFKKGLVTNILNPKATLFFLALFTQVVSSRTSGTIKILYGVEMVLATFIWFSIVSLLVGNATVRKSYQKRSWIVEIVFSIVLATLGLYVLVDILN